MHDERIAARPSNVLGLPVTVADTQPRPGVEVSRSLTSRAASSTHSGPPTRLRSCPCSSRSGHSRRPGWSHPAHGGEGVRLGTAAGGGCRSDQPSEEGREGRRSRSGGQRTATRHLRLGRDRHPVNPRRRGQRFRAREAHASQRSLDPQTAGDPRLEGTRLHHCPETARQLDPDDVGKESGAEEHPLERRTQVPQTPVREERVVEHTRQRMRGGVRGRRRSLVAGSAG